MFWGSPFGMGVARRPRALSVLLCAATACLTSVPGASAQTCAPTLLGSHDTPGRSRGLHVVGTTAYVADYQSGLQIIDVSGCSCIPDLTTMNAPVGDPNYGGPDGVVSAADI